MTSLTCYINISDIIIPLITIPIIDLILCLIFGTLSRWFQLHSVINAIIVSIIYKDIIELYINPLNNKLVDTKLDCYYVIFLHIYHLFISKQLSFMDYFHHIIFIGFGCGPAFLTYNNNLMRLSLFASCGFTGAIEYFTLALVKHKKLNVLIQKKLNAYMYNYLRYPLSMYSIIATYIVYRQNPFLIDNLWLFTYINLMIFFNGSFYNKLTIENYIEYKLIKMNTNI